MNDSLTLKGTYTLEIRDINGNVRDFCTINNLITTTGKAAVALLIGDASANPFTYIALGTSNSAVAAGQTALVAEISTSGLSRAAATVSRVTTTTTNDTFKLVKVFTASGTVAVEEIGVFNASSSGDMLSRALTSTKTVANGETLTATYTCALS